MYLSQTSVCEGYSCRESRSGLARSGAPSQTATVPLQSVKRRGTMPAMHYVAYYRVSTDRQGQSGLGLDAQRAAVAGYLAGRGELLAEFTEVESGRRTDRPELAAALARCRQKKARLVIAKLDRLARSVAFISNLMESGVDFVACDMPEANRLTLHILAAVAEHERDMIAQRTKDALAAAKARGVQLGTPNPAAGAAALPQARARRSANARTFRATVQPQIAALHAEGLSLVAIARELNCRGVATARGAQWHAETVRRCLSEEEAA